MNKSSPSSSLNNIHLDEDWTSHPAIAWLFTYKTALLWSLGSFIGILIISSWFINRQTLNAEKDFFQAQTAFNQFQKIPMTDDVSINDLQELESLMQRHPELKPKYQGQLAQTLIMNGDVLHAQAFTKDIFKRTSPDRLALYQDYTQTSLVIAQGHYAAALQRAQQLKLTLDQPKDNPLLYVFNLIRLAMLYQQMGEPQQELKTWEELQNHPFLLNAFITAGQTLNMENVSLNQYISERKNTLTK